jgi:hypothetical protein
MAIGIGNDRILFGRGSLIERHRIPVSDQTRHAGSRYFMEMTMDTDDTKKQSAPQRKPDDPANPQRAQNQDSANSNPASAGDGKAAPAPVNTAISSGAPIDDAGGAGLGKPPGTGDRGTATAPQTQEKPAADPQDRREDGA